MSIGYVRRGQVNTGPKMGRRILLGIDIGTSAVKACALNSDDGSTLAQAVHPSGSEMAVSRPQPDWAEQDPADWWQAVVGAVRECLAQVDFDDCAGIGVAYQMHGLVLTDDQMRPLRPAIIWCDSRAVMVGESLAAAVGPEYCAGRLINQPGNFTASKLAWVHANEPQVAAAARWMMLPGDYVCARLTGQAATTATGLSEMALWDHQDESLATELLQHTGQGPSIVPPVVPCAGHQGNLTLDAAGQLGLPAGTPVTYRAGDQSNNALALGVLEPGQVAATGGTSGVAYAVTEGKPYDPHGSVNTFLHVNHSTEVPRRGVLMCLNGCGSTMSWLREVTGDSYPELDRLAGQMPVGAGGAVCLPFGNGAERTLQNRTLGLSVHRLEAFGGRPQLGRAVQEGIAFAFAFGLEAVSDLGIPVTSLRACETNMFKSPAFREAIVNTVGVPLDLRFGDGAVGGAVGAGAGAGIWSFESGAEAACKPIGRIVPEPALREQYGEAYSQWKRVLAAALAE